MWPWEHLAFAYVLFSLSSRIRWQRPPTARALLVLAVASALPDLVDKPLAWWVTVLPAGRSLGHSLLVAAPVVAVVLVAGALVDERPIAVAYVIGHLSHLAGDVVYPLIVKGELRVGFLAWPLAAAPAGEPTQALPHLQDLVGAFLAFLSTPRGAAYLAGEVGLLVLALGLWLADGRPGASLFWPGGADPVSD